MVKTFWDQKSNYLVKAEYNSTFDFTAMSKLVCLELHRPNSGKNLKKLKFPVLFVQIQNIGNSNLSKDLNGRLNILPCLL